ncbi:hypothetical protein BH11VER1_BH11VER1_38950 [soil metagenome]
MKSTLAILDDFWAGTALILAPVLPSQIACKYINFSNVKFVMKKFRLSGICLSLMALMVLCHFPSNLLASTPYTPPPAQPQGEGSKVGGFFKGLFYGRSSSGRYMGEKPNTHVGSSGYSLDRPPQESAPAPAVASMTPAEPAPLPPHESTAPPKEIVKNTVPEPKIVETKPTPKKADTPPVTIKPAAEEALPSESPKATVTAHEKSVPKIEPTIAANTPAANNDKRPVEPKITPPAPSSEGPPVGSRTDKTGRVKSPYPPYNELDVSGLQSGSLAMDPTTQKVFRLP